jgi:hypothetical protein
MAMTDSGRAQGRLQWRVVYLGCFPFPSAARICEAVGWISLQFVISDCGASIFA